MKKGLLIYDEVDIEKNKGYINWLIEEGLKYNLIIELCSLKECQYKIQENYDFIINRSRDYQLSKQYENNNIKVFNNSRFCKLGNDKKLAYDFVEELNIKYPKVFTKEEEIKDNNLKIVKPKNGHGGEGINLYNGEPIDIHKSIYQEYIKDYIGDIRFYIINNKITHSVIRKPKGKSLVSNFTKGGEVTIYNIKEEDKDIIKKILKEINIDYGGIDFLLLKDGKILFNEFEDAVGSRMLSYLGINNTMELFLSHISKEINK
ncbi:ATP-grasp domain-containing protein [Clostridium sp.]|uniref:ATP-grasp domain-containing protein n=1 Tax=Clostridium sp. TaxID=1506 RepID=UPI002638C842|nr:ATP-grasp domain-containing protein [Clostridium sp.]